MELKEAIEIFHGITSFHCTLQTDSKEEQAYLQREKIFYNLSHELDVSPELYQLIREKKEAIRKHIDLIFKLPYFQESYLIKAIRVRLPISRPPPLEEQILYLCRTEFLLYLALSFGIILPIPIQKFFGINQFSHKAVKLSDRKKIHLQALAQVLWSMEENYYLPQKKIINLMKEVIFDSYYRGEKLYPSTLRPIIPYYSRIKKQYFGEENQNSLRDVRDVRQHTLRSLLKEVDPRPQGTKIGRPKKSADRKNQNTIQSIPGVFGKISSSLPPINYEKLNIAIGVIGYYLYALRLVSNLEEALVHPLIVHYTPNISSLVNFTNFSLEHYIDKRCTSPLFK